jgi:hypothetical protein
MASCGVAEVEMVQLYNQDVSYTYQLASILYAEIIRL